jgi:hypothetical protein
MRRRSALVIVLVAALTGASATPAGAAEPTIRYHYLHPGGQPQLTEQVPVNVVFVGYEPAQVGQSAFTAQLARRYEPVVAAKLANYGVTEKLGITYTYDYHLSYADAGYENKFFKQLGTLAKAAPLTSFQEDYNAQTRNILNITKNYAIDAPSVEKWLAQNPPSGVDTRRNTIFFINWYGRSDFKFHVYTKTGEADPDTGYDFGTVRQSRKVIAWGGTTADDEETGLGSTRRVWFHDLSAGPESWTSNYDVDNADVDGDDVPDYRMPPTWEYTAGGYRAPSALAGDLGKITRYVALDLLMTTSPLYPVELPTPEPPQSINVDSNTYEGWPGVDASTRYLTPQLVAAELSELRWRNRLDTDQQDLPFDARAQECYDKYFAGETCYPGSGLPSDANLFLYNRDNLARVLDDAGRVDYEVPVFNYAVADGTSTEGLLGFADQDYRTGAQSYVFTFISPQVVESGYGLTTTQIHEVGHHLGMAHPHDGYDSETNRTFDPTGDLFFAWAGDESNSVMSYIDLNWDFSQFDRDNSDRFLTAAYWEAANRLAATIPAPTATAELDVADRLLGRAAAAFARHDYRGAYGLAESAYGKVVQGAHQAGVDPASAATAMKAEADALRAAFPDEPHGVVDTLTPDNPRSRP